MKQLIELLNEYIENHHNKSDLYYLFELEDGMLFCYDDVTDVQWTMQDEAMVICSKKFGFIKRLVDNNKIKLGAYDYDGYHMNVCNYKDMLMLLSIQDNPIQFLCDILK